MLLEALDNRVNVLPYLSIAARLDDGLVEDAVGLVHLHHAVMIDAEAQQGGKPHKEDQIIAPHFTSDKPRFHLVPLIE